MAAVKAEQSRSVNSADDLLPLLNRWLTDHPKMQGQNLTAGQIASGLLLYSSVSASLAKIISSAMMLSNKLTSSSQYVALLGMKTVNGPRVKMFSFRLPDSEPWQAVGLAPPKRVADATAQLFNDLDPIGRFAKEQLVEDPEAFLTSEDLKIAYSVFLDDNGQDAYMDERELIGRLKALPGVKQVTRKGPQGAQQRGLAGRRVKGNTRITGALDVPTGRMTRVP